MDTALWNLQTVASKLATVGATDRNVDVKVGYPLAKGPFTCTCTADTSITAACYHLTWIASALASPWPAR